MGANRAARRAMMRSQKNKNAALLASYNKQQRMAELIKNGITPKDLEESYNKGVEEGLRHAGFEIITACYAGICIALHDEFGFGTKRCFRALEHIDQKITWALNNEELAEEALAKAGIELNFKDEFARVQQKGA